MSSTQSHDSPDTESSPVWDAVETVRNSVLLMLALAGVVMFLAGAILQYGVVAAMLGIWGAGLFLVGATGYTLLWYSRQ